MVSLMYNYKAWLQEYYYVTPQLKRIVHQMEMDKLLFQIECH